MDAQLALQPQASSACHLSQMSKVAAHRGAQAASTYAQQGLQLHLARLALGAPPAPSALGAKSGAPATMLCRKSMLASELTYALLQGRVVQISAEEKFAHH